MGERLDGPTDSRSRIADVVPLSPLQSGLFFHATSGGPDVYRYQLRLGIEGPLDRDLLHRCADRLLARHTALRTAFLAEETDEPVGVVLEGVGLPWREVDLSTASPARRDAECRALAAGERARPFPLDRAPLLRMLLVRLGSERHELVLTNHHIVLDGWSVPVLLRELFTLYAHRGDPAALPPARPFRDHLAWLAEHGERHVGRWADALAGLTGPTLIAAPNASADRPKRYPVPLDGELSAALAGLARDRGVTLNTVLQVLWGITLGIETGRPDVVFGTTVTGRPAEVPGSADMVGLFVNTVPVRIRTDPGEPVGELLGRVQREQAALLDAHHVGLARLQRETGFAPMFDSLLVFESYPTGGTTDALASTGLSVTPIRAEDATHYPLVLVAAPGEPISAALKYQPGALADERVARIAARFVALARSVTEAPGRTPASLETLTAGERRELRDWNDTAAPVLDVHLAGLFERAVARDPDGLALRWSGGELTYRELERRANQVAHRLHAHGGPFVRGGETRIGLYLPRSPELVIAMLAVLKAGGAFVAIDPDWPPLRAKTVAADAGVVAVCARPGDVVPLDAPLVPVSWDDPVADGMHIAPRRHVDGEALAYVIYTSGSTGTPKGAMIRQRSIANRMVWQAGLLGFGPGDVALFKAPLGFDISINEIFLPLTTGAALVIAEPGVERDVESLVRLITGERVSFCYLVSSMLAAMLELPDFSPGALRHVWCGGELLTPELFARFRASVAATMYHGYGPAEATIGVTHEIYRPGRARDGATIGRPNPNTRVQVLDQLLRPAPPGVVGELYVGGLLLGRGYVGDPRRSAERFVADPSGGGERLYRTGDLASWLPDGRLRFAGRSDNQIKIRGMRVEPEEVESVLGGHPSVAQAAVLTPPDATGAPRLVGCYAPRAGADIGPVELRGWLRERLAEHLVPAALVRLAELPTHPSGKVDRDGLARHVPEPRAGGAAARTATERRVLGWFREVLGRDDAGVHDDFFALGGHSLLATRLVVRVRSGLDVELAVHELFAHPTVAELAARLDSGEQVPRRADGVLLPLRTTGTGPPLFCVHPVSGLARAYAGLLGPLPDRPVYGLQALSLAGATELPADLDDMARDYVAEIRAVQPHGPYHLLGWSLGGTVAHLMACQLAEEGARVDTLALLDSVPAPMLAGADDEHWSMERGLARLLAAGGYRVGADEIELGAALAMIAGSAGSLTGCTADELCGVVLSWHHSAGLRAGADPVHPGDLLLFEAAAERHDDLAALWRPRVAGEVRTRRLAATHWGMADPGPLAEVAARLR